MISRTRIVDGGPPTLVLRERDGTIELVSGGVVLLSSAALETERAFGRLAARAGGTAGERRVLVGGLGFGATVVGVLESCDASARVVVVEKVAAVERLVRGELATVAGRPLDDPRVEVVIGDVSDVLARAYEAFDAILVDVDNGPHAASFRTNARLYTPGGLAVACAALRPGGLLAVWSGYPADTFLASLRRSGLAPSVEPLLERGRVRARAYVGRRAPLAVA
jgi:spermidine synthase